MEELRIKDKEKYLSTNYPFTDIPKLTDTKKCIYCNSVIIVGEYKVFKSDTGFEYICCPAAPKCKGTVIDWVNNNY